MKFSRQEYWSGLPFPPPGHLPDPGIETGFPALQADSLPSEPPRQYYVHTNKCSLAWLLCDSLTSQPSQTHSWKLASQLPEADLLVLTLLPDSTLFTYTSGRAASTLFTRTYASSSPSNQGFICCFPKKKDREREKSQVIKDSGRQWHPTPVLLPGKSHGQRSLVGCSPWGR